MTIQEASERYRIPLHILREYERWGLCRDVKDVMGAWQYDQTDIERLAEPEWPDGILIFPYSGAARMQTSQSGSPNFPIISTGGFLMSKKLAAHFSATGTTCQAAEWLASAIGADLFEIRPAQPYTSADLDWTNKRSRSSLEMNNPACRPEIAAQCPNMAQYDTVFIGFPIWWYVAPSIINTFVERYDFSGKTLVPFATSGGSGLGRTVAGLKKLCPAANWNEGKLVNGMSEQALRSWATEL